MTELHKQAIAQQVAPLSGLTEEQVLQCIEEPKIHQANADLAIPIGKLNRFKKQVGNPADLAAEWKDKITPNQHIISVSSEGPYLNFVINRTTVVESVLKKVFAAGDSWGTSPAFGAGKTVIVEFSSPNIAKPFHAGHLRSTYIGNFIKNLHIMLGYKTIAMNYLGDWGKQYGLLAIGFEKFGSEELLVKDPIKHLFDVYVKINAIVAEEKRKADSYLYWAWDILTYPFSYFKAPKVSTNDLARAYFKRMEDGDAEVLAQWKRFRDLSIEEYANTYERLNIAFDVYTGESEQSEGMVRAEHELEELNLLTVDNGATIVELKQAYNIANALIKKTDGTTLYLTRDIAAATTRSEMYAFDEMYYVVGAQQDLHLKQLFKILELMGKDFANKVHHVGFGQVLGMKTRTGNVVFLSHILDTAKEKMLEVMMKNPEKMALIDDPEETAHIVGLSAIVLQDFSAKRNKDYAFDEERVYSFEGDTGPYLQYQHARLHSMARNTGVRVTSDIDYSLLSEPLAQDMAQLIGKYPEVILHAKATLEPVTVATYLFELAHKVSQSQKVLKVKGSDVKLAEARMALLWAARITLASGLRLMGLVPLERM